MFWSEIKNLTPIILGKLDYQVLQSVHDNHI